MKHLDFYFDFVSPYSKIVFEVLPKELQGLSYSVAYKTIFLGAMLKEIGTPSPQNNLSKTMWKKRHVDWLAERNQVNLVWPSIFPFNSLYFLRLAIASGMDGKRNRDTNRYVCELIFRHLWDRNGESNKETAEQFLALEQKYSQAIQDEEVKKCLKQNTEDALTRGIFGVPSLVVDDQVFWGYEGLSMLKQYFLESA